MTLTEVAKLSKGESTSNAMFHGDEIDMTGRRWDRCRFYMCRLICNTSDIPTETMHCSYTDCEFVGDGWPEGFVAANTPLR